MEKLFYFDFSYISPVSAIAVFHDIPFYKKENRFLFRKITLILWHLLPLLLLLEINAKNKEDLSLQWPKFTLNLTY